jgi:hypothetical protein
MQQMIINYSAVIVRFFLFSRFSAVLCTFFGWNFSLVSFFTIRAFFNSLLILSFFCVHLCWIIFLFYEKIFTIFCFILSQRLLFIDAAFGVYAVAFGMGNWFFFWKFKSKKLNFILKSKFLFDVALNAFCYFFIAQMKF